MSRRFRVSMEMAIDRVQCILTDWLGVNEIHHSDVEELVKDSFSIYIYATPETAFMFDDPVKIYLEPYKQLTQNEHEFLRHEMTKVFSYIVSTTIGTINQNQYQSVNWISPTCIEIEQLGQVEDYSDVTIGRYA